MINLPSLALASRRQSSRAPASSGRAAEAAEPALAEAAESQAASMGAEAAIDGQQSPAIDRVETVTIEGINLTPSLAVRSSEENTKKESACTSARDDAQSPPPQLSQAAAAGGTGISAQVVENKEEDKKPVITVKTIKATPTQPLVNEVDAAYQTIPEAERGTWYERADKALKAAGASDWARIVPAVREMAFRLWVGSTIPGAATG